MLEKQEAAGQHGEQNPASALPISLSGEINIATRALHTSLNRLITSRLPLALPPHTPDSSLYATGLLHFAHIYLTFESLWADILRDNHASRSSSSLQNGASTTPTTSTDEPTSPPFSPLLSYLLVNPYDSPSLFTPTLGAPTPPSHQLTALLATLRPKGLLRSSRLKRDLEHLLSLHPTNLEVLLARYPGDKVAEFCTHIRHVVNAKPWTLVAYAWCFYMAIFSGGRWIRGGLLKAPAGFWPASIENESAEKEGLGLKELGLSFWHFPGERDGEDIKAAFKERLAAAEDLFTPDERVDIIEEAKHIFRFCAELVGELDQLVGTDLTLIAPAAANLPHQQQQQQPSTPTPDSDSASNTTSVLDLDPTTLLLSVQASDAHPHKPSDVVTSFIRRPEVSGTLIALGCLACLVVLKLQPA